MSHTVAQAGLELAIHLPRPSPHSSDIGLYHQAQLFAILFRAFLKYTTWGMRKEGSSAREAIGLNNEFWVDLIKKEGPAFKKEKEFLYIISCREREKNNLAYLP